jgi:hypothetical protein
MDFVTKFKACDVGQMTKLPCPIQSISNNKLVGALEADPIRAPTITSFPGFVQQRRRCDIGTPAFVKQFPQGAKRPSRFANLVQQKDGLSGDNRKGIHVNPKLT